MIIGKKRVTLTSFIAGWDRYRTGMFCVGPGPPGPPLEAGEATFYIGK
jgi:hypothetical protein